jgi:hypothetical protein
MSMSGSAFWQSMRFLKLERVGRGSEKCGGPDRVAAEGARRITSAIPVWVFDMLLDTAGAFTAVLSCSFFPGHGTWNSGTSTGAVEAGAPPDGGGADRAASI